MTVMRRSFPLLALATLTAWLAGCDPTPEPAKAPARAPEPAAAPAEAPPSAPQSQAPEPVEQTESLEQAEPAEPAQQEVEAPAREQEVAGSGYSVRAPVKAAPIAAPVPPRPRASPPAQPSGSHASKPRPSVAEQELPPIRLDLSLPRELVDELEPGQPLVEEKPLLPPLFIEKEAKPAPFQLSGQLITNERDRSRSEEDKDTSYLDRVDGAQLNFEFRN